METIQNKLIDDMEDIKSTQAEHHTANTQMHENTAKLLQQLLDLNTKNDKVNEVRNTTQKCQRQPKASINSSNAKRL